MLQSSLSHHWQLLQAYAHACMYEDDQFARHSHFIFFALDTEIRCRVLQAGRIYIRQHPSDVQLTVDELCDMVGRLPEGEAFSNRVLHYDASLRGTRQYWFRQRSCLIFMVTPGDCPPFSSPMVQLICSGHN